MSPTIERKYPETMEMEEYLRRRKESRKKQQNHQIEDIIQENAAWIVAAFSM